MELNNHIPIAIEVRNVEDSPTFVDIEVGIVEDNPNNLTLDTDSTTLTEPVDTWIVKIGKQIWKGWKEYHTLRLGHAFCRAVDQVIYGIGHVVYGIGHAILGVLIGVGIVIYGIVIVICRIIIEIIRIIICICLTCITCPNYILQWLLYYLSLPSCLNE